MANATAGRFQRATPVACFALAAVAGLTAVSGLVGSVGYSLDRGLGLMDLPAGLMLGVPFAAVSVMVLFAGINASRIPGADNPGPRLERARTLVTFSVVPLIASFIGAIGLGFLDASASPWWVGMLVTVARLGVPAVLLGWILAVVIVWKARIRLAATTTA